MLSFWEKESFLNYDFIVIGSGIVGLSAALSIRDRQPEASILILERGILPTGASTKNAGFACIGSLTEILDDLSVMQGDEVLKLVELRFQGLQLLRKRVGDMQLQYKERGSFELISKDESDALDKIDAVNKFLAPVLKIPAYSLADDRLDSFGFSRSVVSHMVKNNLEGELHTGSMMRALLRLCSASDIEVRTGCNVSEIEEDEKSVTVAVNHLQLNETVFFKARKVIVCTNAFTSHLYKDEDVKPGRGQVIITDVVDKLPFQGIFHFLKGYYYFREINGRVLFGGGRNLDFEGETSTQFEHNQKVLDDLEVKLRTIILPNQSFRVADSWTGIMAFGESKFPIIKKKGNHVFLGVRMGGMGVAIGSKAGELLADLACKS